MNDLEIKKALECCDGSFDMCEECPLDNVIQDKLRCWELEKSALDLINRQEEENESLKAEVERLRKAIEKTDYAYFKKSCELDNLIYDIELLKQEKSVVKAEAYKEFAELVKGKFNDGEDVMYLQTLIHFVIDNLLKELVGDNNAGEN